MKPPPLPTCQPPPLSSTTRTPAWLFLCGVGLGVYARLASDFRWPFPPCWLRTLTGVPCPACGCTRSLLAWSKFDLVQAAFFNPLFFLGCIAVALWMGVWVLEKVFARAWSPRFEAFFYQRPVWRLLALLAVLNWLYLCLELPE